MKNLFSFSKLLSFIFLIFFVSQTAFSQMVFYTNSCGYLQGNPSFYETEVCGEHTNHFFNYHASNADSIFVAYEDADPLPFPTAGNSLNLRGSAAHRYLPFPTSDPNLFDYLNIEDYDSYSFQLSEITELKVILQRKNSSNFVYVKIFKIPDYLAISGSGYIDQNDFVQVMESFAVDFFCIENILQIPSFSLAPGTYCMRVANGYSFDNFEYPNAYSQPVGYGDSIDADLLQQGCVDGKWDYGVVIENLTSSHLPCANAVPITVGPTFADFEISGATESVALNSPAQCIGPGSRPEKWYKFVPVTSNSYVRAWGNGDFNAAVEVYDGCSGNLIKCQNEVGPGEREIVILPGLNIGQTYYYRVYHVGSSLPANNTYLTSSAHIPFIWLTPSLCNSNVVNGQWLTSTQPVTTFLLNGRRWRFTEITLPYNSYEYTVNGTSNRINWNTFTQKQLGKTYTVQVKTRQYQGSHWGEYSNACMVSYLSAGIMQPDGEPESTENESWFSIYPNPSNGGEVNISFNTGSGADELVSLMVYDLAGRLVHSRQLQGVDASGFANVSFEGMLTDGAYIARIVAPSGFQLTEKFMVQK